jgi:transcriptional regulator with XRE-family HTH domain
VNCALEKREIKFYNRSVVRMGRKPRSIKGETLPSRILDVAFRHKARRLGVEEYSIAQLERDSLLHHSVIARAAEYDPESGKGSQPTLKTVRKLAETLEVSTNPEFEDTFYNAFLYASPRQLSQVRHYVETTDG